MIFEKNCNKKKLTLIVLSVQKSPIPHQLGLKYQYAFNFCQKHSKQSTFEIQVLENFWGPVINFGASYDDKYKWINDDLW